MDRETLIECGCFYCTCARLSSPDLMKDTSTGEFKFVVILKNMQCAT